MCRFLTTFVHCIKREEEQQTIQCGGEEEKQTIQDVCLAVQRLYEIMYSLDASVRRIMIENPHSYKREEVILTCNMLHDAPCHLHLTSTSPFHFLFSVSPSSWSVFTTLCALIFFLTCPIYLSLYVMTCQKGRNVLRTPPLSVCIMLLSLACSLS